MISPAELRKKAEKKYPELLKAWLNGEQLFPMRIPANLQATGSTPSERVKELEELKSHSRDVTGRPGFLIEYRSVNTRDRGAQTLPQAIRFDSEQDFVHYIGREAEYNNYRNDCELILEKLPVLMPWLSSHPKSVVKYSGSWPALLDVCQYLFNNPLPGVYVRLLPLQCDTKFIERHEPILRNLLDQVLLKRFINLEQEDFYTRYGLLRDDARIRFRVLDQKLVNQFSGLTDISVPVHEFTELVVDCGRVLLVENKSSFLSLPPLENTMAVFGSGNAVVLLARCAWLHSRKLVYWGDMDMHGLAILARMRERFPQLQSVMMDKASYDAHVMFAHTGKICNSISLEQLNENERELFLYLQKHSSVNRIEQEKLPSYFIEQQLSKLE